MNTALVSPCYLDGLDPSGSSRFERTKRWINWNWASQWDIWLFDNASNKGDVSYLRNYADVYRYLEHLPRGEGPNPYPYCWRALWNIRDLIQLGYEKIIWLDTDSFIVSNRLLAHVAKCNSGWEAFWIPKYNFPSGEFFILNEDAFPKFLEYTEGHWSRYQGELFENHLPFTKVNKDFKTDRYGETRTPQTPEMDGYFQAPTDVPLEFK